MPLEHDTLPELYTPPLSPLEYVKHCTSPFQ